MSTFGSLEPHELLKHFQAFDLPDGKVDHLYLHWSAGAYDKVSSAYHFVVGYRDGRLFAQQTHDVRENMRPLSEDSEYAAHTARRNSYAIGVSALSMCEATPRDFGPAPLTEELIDALCAMCAHIVKRYNIPLDAEHVMTHAEAAIIDGYFGLLPEERWDLARFSPSEETLTAAEAIASGNELRRRIRAYVTNS